MKIAAVVLGTLLAAVVAVVAASGAAPASKLARNTRVVLSWYNDVMAKGDVERSSQVQADDYIQHATGVATGNAGFRAWAKRIDMANNPFVLDVIATIAEGDYVAVFQRSNRPGRGEVGYMDLFRVNAEGKLAEHWGVVEPAPTPEILLHSNGFITRPPPIDLHQVGKEARNTRVVRASYDEVLGGDIGPASGVQVGGYTEHAEGVAPGDTGFRAFAKPTDLAHRPLKAQILKTVAQGDYVFVFRRQAAAPDAPGGIRAEVALMDWFRLRDGKLAEHWGLVQQAPPPERLLHTNGFFGGLPAPTTQ